MAIILPKQVGTEEGKLLFQRAEEVKDFDKSKEIVKFLKGTLEYYGGMGLAAPQIGISKRVFALNIRPTEKYPHLPKIGFKAYFNPKILTISSDSDKDSEGCLSIFYGTLYGLVKRPNKLKVKYLNIEGEEQVEEIIHPLQSRIILHEKDHLDGKIFLQRIEKDDFSKLYWNEKLDIKKMVNLN